MIYFQGQTVDVVRVDDIYFGQLPVGRVYKGSELIWEPTEIPSEEEQFNPDEHHPVDPLFTDEWSMGFGIYMKIWEFPLWSVAPRIKITGTTELRFEQAPVVVYDYWNQDWPTNLSAYRTDVFK